LFSQTKSRGSFQSDAMLSVSWNSPSPVAPSPKKHAATAPWSSSCAASAAAGDRHAAGDDAVGAQHPDGEVGDVHRAALALAIAVGAAEELGHHPVDVGALGDAVPVAPVGARDAIGRAQRGAHADGDSLLADVGMKRPVDPLCRAQLDREHIELADQDHLPEDLDQLHLVL